MMQFRFRSSDVTAFSVAAKAQRPSYFRSLCMGLRSFLMAAKRLRTIDLLGKYHTELVAEWTKELEAAGLQSRTSKEELRGHAEQFLRLLLDAVHGRSLDITS